MIEIVQAKGEENKITNLQSLAGDIFTASLSVGSYDSILLMNILHFIREPEPFLKKISSLLKPAGLLLCAADCMGEHTHFSSKILLNITEPLSALGIVPFMYSYTREEIKKLINETAFSCIDEEVLHPDPVNFFGVFRKEKQRSPEIQNNLQTQSLSRSRHQQAICIPYQ